MTTIATCSKHPHVKLRCPACLGAKGGRVMTPKKLRAIRRNAKKGGRPRAEQE